MKNLLLLAILPLMTACSGQKNEDKTQITNDTANQNLGKIEKYPAEYELKDSVKLTHIKNQFYRNEYGFLYEKTVAQKEFNGRLKDVEYFNGIIAQEIEPNSFRQIKGSWFAKDNKNVYYFRPTSGGMQISKLENADIETFKILEGNYKYAVDKNNFYNGIEIIENFIPQKTEQIKDSKGNVIKLKTGDDEMILE